MDANKLLTVKEAAQYLQLKERTIYAMVTDGRLPSSCIIRIGRNIRFSVDAIKSIGKQDV